MNFASNNEVSDSLYRLTNKFPLLELLVSQVCINDLHEGLVLSPFLTGVYILCFFLCKHIEVMSFCFTCIYFTSALYIDLWMNVSYICVLCVEMMDSLQ